MRLLRVTLLTIAALDTCAIAARVKTVFMVDGAMRATDVTRRADHMGTSHLGGDRANPSP